MSTNLPTESQVDQTGRPLGRRALETRQRLLDTTAQLLAKRRLREIRVVEIARRAGTSPATFYQYFKDVEEAALALAEQASEGIMELAEKIAASWRGQAGLNTARSLVDAYISHWDEHQAVLRLRNLASDEGDVRFRRIRRDSLFPVVRSLAKRIAESQEAGRVSNEMNPHAAAAALAAILERLAAFHKELEPLGVTRDDLVETSARILQQVVTGRRT